MKERIHLYLASASPRRRELLEQMGLRHRVVAQQADERRLPGEAPEAYVQRVACAKAAAGRRALAPGDETPVLGADTIVVCDGSILGKPRSLEQAREMLGLLSGRAHQVLTAVALQNTRRSLDDLSRTTVEFRELSDEEIQAYWDSGEPRDKAGAYAVQGRGALFVRHISGSYSGVVGLPVFETARLLEEFDVTAVDWLRSEVL